MTAHIVALLDRLAEAREEQAAIAARHEKQRAKLLKPIAGKLASIDEQLEEQLANPQAREEALIEEIKAATIDAGQSVKGEALHAVFTAGRISWDSSRLEGLAAALPAILDAKSVGQASVSIRPVKA